MSSGRPFLSHNRRPDSDSTLFDSSSQMARRFATLTTLDQQPIDPNIAFKAAEQSAKLTPGLSPSIKSATAKKKQRDPIVFPVPVTGGFFESEPTRDFVGGFLTKSVESLLLHWRPR